LDPAVNEIEICPFPAVATREVGALGVVDGVPDVEVDATPATEEYARI
jgi:hypothetical protein